MYSIRTQNVYFHYNVQELILKFTKTVYRYEEKCLQVIHPQNLR